MQVAKNEEDTVVRPRPGESRDRFPIGGDRQPSGRGTAESNREHPAGATPEEREPAWWEEGDFDLDEEEEGSV